MNAINSERKASDKIQLILIFAIPLVGLLLMTGYYFYVTKYKVETGTHNYGVLIHPPKQSLELEITEEGVKAQLANHNDRWAFVVVNKGECLGECQGKLYLTRQIQAAMGKYSPRVQNVYLQLGAPSKETSALFVKEYGGHKFYRADVAAAQSWFSKSKPELTFGDASFYVVDPRGWVMMYYTEKNTYKEVIKDMKFLLKNS